MRAAQGAVNGRAMPHSLDAEQAVLGAVLWSPTALAEVIEVIQAEDFYRPHHRTVFEGVLELFAAGQAVDAVTVADWLMSRGRLDDIGGASAIHDLIAEVPSAANAVYYAGIVRDLARLRRVIEAGTQVARLGYENEHEVDVIVDRAEQLLYQAAQERGTSQCEAIGGPISEALAEIERLQNGLAITGLATGYDPLDEQLGGLQAENLVVIAARPGVGKSSLALGILRHVAVELGHSAVLFNLEMSKREIAQRLLAMQAGIQLAKIRRGQVNDDHWARLTEAAGRVGSAQLQVDDSPTLTLPQIRSKCRRLKQQQDLSVVVVDYLQLLPGPRRTDNRVQEVSDISRGLKLLAKELAVPVVALSQLSREPEKRADKRPQLSDLRESGSIEQDSDVVLLLYRDDLYDEHSPDAGLLEVRVAKHRNGSCGGVIKLPWLAHIAAVGNTPSTGPALSPTPPAPLRLIADQKQERGP